MIADLSTQIRIPPQNRRYEPDSHIRDVSKNTGISIFALNRYFQWVGGGKFFSSDKNDVKAFFELRKKLPPEVIQFPPHPYYRGMRFNINTVHRFLETGKPIVLKDRALTAWTASLAIAEEYARRGLDLNEKNPHIVGVVVKARPKRTILPLTKAIHQYLDPDDYKQWSEQKEVIVLGTGIQTIAPHVIVSFVYEGKSYTLQQFQEKHSPGNFDRHTMVEKIEKLFAEIPGVQLIPTSQDKNRYVFFTRNITGQTFTNMLSRLMREHYYVGKVSTNKRGHTVNTVLREERLGITLEELKADKAIRITVQLL